MSKEVLLAQPRGFCAGVDRAIEIVERAISQFGAPIYVRHEIVHNAYVVNDLRKKGAIFIEELADVPAGNTVVFSAHGVSKAVQSEAAERGLRVFDATCPLVTKVHVEVAKMRREGREIIMIGHDGHPEVEGTMGQVNEGMYLVETVSDVEKLVVKAPDKLAYVSQTTLSVDDTADVIAAIKRKFPLVVEPKKGDICYATTNRQEAVKAIAPGCDALLVVGAPNSSNSRRLVEVAAKNGCPQAQLVQRASEIDWRALEGIRSVGITAGASAPELLVQEAITACRDRFAVDIEEVSVTVENVHFKLPRALSAYRTLYRRLAPHVAPDGMLIACCCTSRISLTELRRTRGELDVARLMLERLHREGLVGRLAATTVHDINNLLTVILSQASYVRSDMGVSEEARECLRDVELSAREIEVLDGMRRGLTNKDIALSLSLSEHTVKAHVKSVLSKLESADRAAQLKAGTLCMVISGRAPGETVFNKVLDAVRAVRAKHDLKVCACLGLLNEEQVLRLKEAGVETVNSSNQ